MEKNNKNLKNNKMNKINNIIDNPYLPKIATIKEIIKETKNIISLRLVIDDEEEMKKFNFKPGQVGQISVFGFGESTFAINSSPLNKDYLQFSIMKTGITTTAIHNLDEREKVGLKAPLGNWFPNEEMIGKNVLLIGGGIGMAPLKPLIFYMLANRNEYKKITLLYGARTPKDLCFMYNIEDWEKPDEIDVVLTIDREYPGWEKEVGLIPHVLERIAPSSENTVAVTCGPPIMIKFTLQSLEKLGFKEDMIYTTLERRMKCGVGKCGRCNIGEKFVCIDGPVFSLKQLNSFCESFM